MPRINSLVFNSALQWWCDRKLLDLLWYCVTESYICLLIFLLLLCFRLCEFLHRVTGVLSAKTEAISNPNLCYCQRWRSATTQGLDEERGVNSVLLNAWGWRCNLIMGSFLNQSIKCCDHKGPFENWSRIRKTDTGDVGCILFFLYKKVKIVGIKVILHSNQGKAKLKKRYSSVLFSKESISSWIVFELCNAKRVSWGHAWKEESAAMIQLAVS